MALKGGGNYRKKTISTSSDKDYYYEKGTKVILPETSIPTFGAQVRELKKTTSYWQIGMASLSRVKINVLRSDVTIRADQATTINGTFSELYGPVETLGTTIVHIFDIPVEVHVTRSKMCAPIVADGILGYDFLSEYSFSLSLGSQGRLILRDYEAPISVPPAKELIADYMYLLRRKIVENSVAQERGAWSVVSKELLKLRGFFPLQVAEDDRLPVIETLEEYADCFHRPGDKLSFTPLLKYSVKSKDNEVVRKEQPKLSHEHWNDIERQVANLLHHEIIRVSTSPYNSPVRLIEKKPNSKGKVYFRLAVEYRQLNKKCHGDGFPIPDIIDLIDQLHGAKYFSVLDLASASYQIALDPKDCSKTAFTTRSGRYEFQRMPAGIKNASQNLQRLMHQVLDGMLCPSIVFVCHDDILIHAATLAEHEIRVRKVLARLRDAGLKLQPDKCQLFRSNVTYLGYRITEEGLRPDPVKIHKLKIQPLPNTVRSLSSFLGLLSSFKRFIPNYVARAKAMSNLLKGGMDKVEWTEEARRSFNDLKNALSEDWLLQYPDWDREFILETSSSHLGIAAALMQRKSDDAQPLPIAYTSRCWTYAEANEDEFNQERLAAIYGMETWYWYFSELDGKKFILKTPKPRAFDWYLRPQWHNSAILARFELAFSGKDFTIQPLCNV